MIPVLTFSNLFPNECQPRHGLFVEERLAQLTATGAVRATVIAPVPWFPATHPRFGRYAEFAKVPRSAERRGIRVLHPRYPTVPKIGMAIAPALMAAALLPVVRRVLAEEPDIALIDSHFLYPDGVAATLIGAAVGLPVLMTARGSDVNLFTQYRLPRRFILSAARRSHRVITVSEHLRDRLLSLGVAPAKVVTLRNGVDLTRFHPREREAARARTGMTGKTLLSVGNLFELKGHHLVIEALALRPDWRAVIVGEGDQRGPLETLARSTGVAGRVRFTGNLPQADLLDFYAGADALVLASSREGMPNVVLESLACGTPVIATAVGGVPEILDAEAAGVLLPERSAAAIADALAELDARPRDRDAVAAHGARFGWEPTVKGLLEVMSDAAGRRSDAVDSGSRLRAG